MDFNQISSHPYCHVYDEPTSFRNFARGHFVDFVTITIFAATAFLSGCSSSQHQPSIDSDAVNNTDKSSMSTKDNHANSHSIRLAKANISQSKIGNIPEKMNNVQYRHNVVSASVISNGCTNDNHFTVNHTLNGSTCQLLIVRNKPDKCKAAPYLQNISISWNKKSNCDDRELIFLNSSLPDMENNTIKGIKK